MSRSLPSKPSITHLRNEAKSLHKAHSAGDKRCCETLALLHRFNSLSAKEILSADLALREAQHALALDYGFRSWRDLTLSVERTVSIAGATRRLEEFQWYPHHVSQLGCIIGALDYLGVGVSDSWLFGASGYAFMIAIEDGVCPSSVTAWNYGSMHHRLRNVGCEVECLMFANKTEEDFESKQETAWLSTRRMIDERLPCFGWCWEPEPEFYVFNAYDQDAYYYSGVKTENARMPWRKLGVDMCGSIEMFTVKPCDPADDAKVVKDSLEFAVDHATAPGKYAGPENKTGVHAYDTWMKALRENTADAYGTAFNAVVWAECRRHAVGFLQEARSRLDNKHQPLFDEAIRHYEAMRERLHEVSDMFPYEDTTDEQRNALMLDNSLRDQTIERLQLARDAEEAGVRSLAGIARKL